MTYLSPLPVPFFSASPPIKGSDQLTANAVHLWSLDIGQFSAAHCVDAEQAMSSEERERAQKFLRGKKSYVASRWLLRNVLARYTNSAAEALEFLRTDKGKPYLPHSDVHFSLSHSGDKAVLAVAKVELIGVDIERVKTMRDLSRIAELYYHPNEFARLQTLHDHERSDYFYRLWTLKEAFFKALGTGISAGLEKIQFALEANEIHAQIAAELGNHASEWHFHQWALNERDYCALAGKSAQPLTVNWFDALATPAFP